MGIQRTGRTRPRGRRLYFAGMLLLYLSVHIWILWGLMRLGEDADIISLYYPAGGITESGFDQWKENEDSGLCAGAAVWRRDGMRRLVSEDTGHGQEAACYQVKGCPEAIFGNALIGGRYFTAGEEGVCLLDQKTVRQLFGSEDVSGLTVSLGGTNLRIAGVLEGDTPICIIPAKKGTVFDGIAVQKKEKEQSFRQTVSLLEAAFGGAKGQRIDGQLYYVTGWLFYAGAAALTVFLAGSLLAENLGKRRPGRRYIVWLCLAVSAVILLSGVKIANPGSDYLPSYWSDFEFFSRIFKEKVEQIQGLMVYQEFDRWQRMLHIWLQVIGGGIFLGTAALLNNFIVLSDVHRFNQRMRRVRLIKFMHI